MNLPEGYTEQQLIEILAGVQAKLSRRFSFGYFDEEDISQFIWEESLILLNKNKYDKGKGPLGGFLYRNAYNRIKNLRRNKLVRPGGLKNKRLEAAKRSLMEPTHLEQNLNCYASDEGMDTSFLQKMPLHLQNDFYREANGVKITPNRKRAFREWVRKQSRASI